MAQGWNLFAYPLPVSRTVTDSLQSIGTSYISVVGFDRNNPADPWRVFDPAAPAWVNDLTELTFGNGYWINLSQAITLSLPVPDLASAMTTEPVSSVFSPTITLRTRTPPAVYYGTISAADIPISAVVEAYVNNDLCGQGTTLPGGRPGELRYRVKVLAADQTSPGCGTPERRVRFVVNSVPLGAPVPWDNERPTVWNLGSSSTSP
jgi:hypothetical protein